MYNYCMHYDYNSTIIISRMCIVPFTKLICVHHFLTTRWFFNTCQQKQEGGTSLGSGTQRCSLSALLNFSHLETITLSQYVTVQPHIHSTVISMDFLQLGQKSTAVKRGVKASFAGVLQSTYVGSIDEETCDRLKRHACSV